MEMAEESLTTANHSGSQYDVGQPVQLGPGTSGFLAGNVLNSIPPKHNNIGITREKLAPNLEPYSTAHGRTGGKSTVFRFSVASA